MKEAKEKLEVVINALPIMKDFGAIDEASLNVLTETLNKVLLLLDS